MNSKGIVAIKDETICMKCLKKKAAHTYYISYRGYGSSFDDMETKFQCCDDCDKPEYDEWFNEKEVMNDYVETYQHEDKILDLIHSLPLESQELFENRFENRGYKMDSQDWIDYELNELPHEKCKEYRMYSPQERAAYKERFPNCECVKINKYKDGSQGSSCPYGAHGDKDGNIGLNIWNECYMCTHYKPREGDIEIIDKVDEYYKNEKDRFIHMIQYAGSRLGELEKSVEKYMDTHR